MVHSKSIFYLLQDVCTSVHLSIPVCSPTHWKVFEDLLRSWVPCPAAAKSINVCRKVRIHIYIYTYTYSVYTCTGLNNIPNIILRYISILAKRDRNVGNDGGPYSSNSGSALPSPQQQAKRSASQGHRSVGLGRDPAADWAHLRLQQLHTPPFARGEVFLDKRDSRTQRGVSKRVYAQHINLRIDVYIHLYDAYIHVYIFDISYIYIHTHIHTRYVI